MRMFYLFVLGWMGRKNGATVDCDLWQAGQSLQGLTAPQASVLHWLAWEHESKTVDRPVNGTKGNFLWVAAMMSCSDATLNYDADFVKIWKIIFKGYKYEIVILK